MAKGMIRWTPDQLAAFEARTGRKPVIPQLQQPAAQAEEPKKRSKHGSKKVEHDGLTFDSGKELSRWLQLQAMEAAGRITSLQRQVPFVLAPGVKLAGEDRKKPDLRYFADATYLENGKLIVEDVKSEHTRKLRTYRDKKHLMKTLYNIDIREI